jgi:hypothetical protein
MPLPINTTLSLFGASRPGDALPSKPKKAMLVRLSSDILDTLEASVQPLVQFELGENPVRPPQPSAFSYNIDLSSSGSLHWRQMLSRNSFARDSHA